MSPKDQDHEWQLEMTRLVAEVRSEVKEVRTENKALHDKVDLFMTNSEKRFEKLDKIVLGNGQPGLAEDVRNMKGRWAFIYGTAILLASAAINSGVQALFK
jgi:uncharacterized membrane protein